MSAHPTVRLYRSHGAIKGARAHATSDMASDMGSSKVRIRTFLHNHVPYTRTQP